MKKLSAKDLVSVISADLPFWYEKARRLTGNHSEHEDLVHDTLIRLERSFRDRGVEQENIDALFYISMRNLWYKKCQEKKELLINNETYDYIIAQIEDVKEINEIDNIKEKIDSVVEDCGNTPQEKWYYKTLYDYLYVKGYSIRKLARETKIDRKKLMLEAQMIRNQIKININYGKE